MVPVLRVRYTKKRVTVQLSSTNEKTGHESPSEKQREVAKRIGEEEREVNAKS